MLWTTLPDVMLFPDQPTSVTERGEATKVRLYLDNARPSNGHSLLQILTELTKAL